MPSAQEEHVDFCSPPPLNKKKKSFKKTLFFILVFETNNLTFHDKLVLAPLPLPHTPHVLLLAEAAAFVPKLLSETRSYFLDAFLISGGSCVSAANTHVTNNKHAISSPVELFHSAYLEVQFCCHHFNHIFQQHITLCNRPFSFAKDKNHCIFHFIS